jgi:FixJ family two-component response regulator
LALIATGRANTQMAKALAVSPSTVKIHTDWHALYFGADYLADGLFEGPRDGGRRSVHVN